MSFRTVRVVTPSRSADPRPGQVGRDCSRASRASSREEVWATRKIVRQRGKNYAYTARSVPVMTNSNDIRPFRIEIPQADLDDLQQRLARTRLPQPAPT